MGIAEGIEYEFKKLLTGCSNGNENEWASRLTGESARPARLVVERAAYMDGCITVGLLLPVLDRTCSVYYSRFHSYPHGSAQLNLSITALFKSSTSILRSLS
jgi:hypothetical protein